VDIASNFSLRQLLPLQLQFFDLIMLLSELALAGGGRDPLLARCFFIRIKLLVIINSVVILHTTWSTKFSWNGIKVKRSKQAV